MIAAVLLFALPRAQYSAQFLASFTGDKYSRQWVSGIQILDTGEIAGFKCDFVGVHGEDFAGKPFVISQGKTIWLPLGKGEYGHVRAAGRNLLAGDVDIDSQNYPAQWTPDPSAGWAKAKLTLLSKEPGYTVAVSPDNTVWMQVGKRLTAATGGHHSLEVDRVDVMGIDNMGRIFGNSYKGLGEGMRRVGQQPVVYAKGEWTPLPVGDEEWSVIRDVSSAGLAVGVCGDRAAVWRDGKLTLLPGSNSAAVAVNSSGVVVGAAYGGASQPSRGVVWDGSTRIELPSVGPEQGEISAEAINRVGEIAMIWRGRSQSRLYLVTSTGKGSK